MNSPLNLSLCVATMSRDNPDVVGWLEQAAGPVEMRYWYNTPEDNRGVVGAYSELYKMAAEDVLIYLHNDVLCREQGWDMRLLKEFEDPQVAVVGFGGALGHGLPDLYKTPYRLEQLQRIGYLSNVDDAEVHGQRFTGSCNVAVLDGFALTVRRSFLDRIGGWSKIAVGCNFFNYDYALCALARRYQQKVRLVGIRCHHRGGATSVNSGQVASVKSYINQDAYDKAHAWYANEFRDTMPARVKP